MNGNDQVWLPFDDDLSPRLVALVFVQQDEPINVRPTYKVRVNLQLVVIERRRSTTHDRRIARPLEFKAPALFLVRTIQ